MRHLPTLPYSGLTIVLDRRSRFDEPDRLLCGQAGSFFDSALGMPRAACDIRLWSTLEEGWLPGTRVVLLLGECFTAFQDDANLNQLRGSPWQSDGKVFVATYAPQDALDRKDYFSDDTESTARRDDDKTTGATTRRQNWPFWMRRDIGKAIDILRNGLHVAQFEEPQFAPVATLEQELSRTRDTHLFLDIETDSQLRLTCLGYKFRGQPTRVIPMFQTHRPSDGYYHGRFDTARLLRALAVAMSQNTTVIHNALFDLFVLAWRYGIPPGHRIIDTMLLQHRLYPDLEKSLGHCLSLYTHQPYHKSEGIFEPHNLEQAQQLYSYNAKDVQSLELLLPIMQQHAAKLDATESAAHACSMVRPYLTAILQGLRLDVPHIRDRITDNLLKQQQVRRLIGIACGYDLNPNSPKQVSQYLYDKRFGMGYKKPPKDPTNEKTLFTLRLKHPNPAIGAILEYRRCSKENGQLGFNFWPGPRSTCDYSAPRTTTGYNLAGTNTFRLASRALLGQWGSNLQNLPKHLRKLVLPDPGKVFVQVDQAGAEALIVAYLCDHRRYREMFLQGIKPHVYVALHMFRLAWENELGFSLQDYCDAPMDKLTSLSRWAEVDEVIKASDDWPASRRYYYLAKQTCHSSNYGIKAPTFRLNVLQKSDGKIALSLSDAQHFLDVYHSLFPEIRSWNQDVTQQVLRTRLLRNLFGHPRQFTGHLDDSAQKEWFAFIPQSTVGTITNFAFVELQRQVEAGTLPADVLQNNHDSVLLQCLPQDVDVVARAASAALNRPLVSPRTEMFFMRSEASVGETWGDMHKWKPTTPSQTKETYDNRGTATQNCHVAA